MSLRTYNKKRKFEKTPEPEGKEAPRGEKLRFVIQKHDASRLHYDLRLELEGAMKSWAVPKGPSLNPADKRLAVMVEDHPIAYNTFEGTIPEGEYGAGEVIVWDNGTYHAETTEDAADSEEEFLAGLKKGHIAFVLEGQKLKGLFHLVRMKDDEKQWLLIKKDDEHASKQDVTEDNRSVLSKRRLIGRNEKKKPSVELPLVRPMLATLVDAAFDDPDWIFELKWDGYRALADINGGEVRLYSRNLLPFNDKYPEIVEALKSIHANVLIDGEVIAFDEEGRVRFEALQNAGQERPHLQYLAFDLLYYEGENIMGWPLLERKKLLRTIIPEEGPIVYSDHVEGKGRQYFALVKEQDFEGIIAKRADSTYIPNARTGAWLKIKHHQSDELVIAGFTAPRRSRKRFGALVLGRYVDGVFTFAGHTGTGFDDKGLAELHEQMKPLITDKSPFREKVELNAPITWIRPELVAQIKFSEWTKGGAMRHPVFVGLREDKPAKSITGEVPTDVEDAKADTPKKSDPRAKRTKSTRSKAAAPKTKTKHKTAAAMAQGFTNLDKIYFPDLGLTKGDVIAYYRRMADTILPYLKDRPESLNRHPDGVGKPGFYHKNMTMQPPPFVETMAIYSESNKADVNYLLCQNEETLLYLAQLGCIELNPWLSRKQALDNPDFCVIDLDPGENTWAELVQVAKEVKRALDESCGISYLKTSGKTGVHILIPLGGKYDYDLSRTFGKLIALTVNSRLPDLTSVERSPSKRTHKIYLDYLQNSRGQTIAAPYSLRPTQEATVSTPLQWSELSEKTDPTAYTIKTIFPRLKKHGDLWADILTQEVDLVKAIECLENSLKKS